MGEKETETETPTSVARTPAVILKLMSARRATILCQAIVARTPAVMMKPKSVRRATTMTDSEAMYSETDPNTEEKENEEKETETETPTSVARTPAVILKLMSARRATILCQAIVARTPAVME